MADYLAVARRALAMLPVSPSTKEYDSPKAGFEGLAGTDPGSFQNIGQPATAPMPAGLPARTGDHRNRSSFPSILCCPSEENVDLQRRVTPESQIFRWVGARCIRRIGVWASEKFLWLDFDAWCQQPTETPCPRELFREIMSQSFIREDDGWQGVVLDIDYRAAIYVMREGMT